MAFYAIHIHIQLKAFFWGKRNSEINIYIGYAVSCFGLWAGHMSWL
jgi:hypothetical protein